MYSRHRVILWTCFAISSLPCCLAARIRPHFHMQEPNAPNTRRISYDISRDVSSNAHQAFNQFEKAISASNNQFDTSNEIVERFTKDELSLYRTRVVEELATETTHKKMNSMSTINARDTAWTSIFHLALQEHMPLMTQYEINEINKRNLGWVAGESDMMKDMTVGAARSLLGVKISDEDRKHMEIQMNTSEQEDHDDASISLLEQNSSNPNPLRGIAQNVMVGLGLAEEPKPHRGQQHQHQQPPQPQLPAQFTVYDSWPQCTETFDHARNQGSCGSCWAQAASSVMESRMCVRTNGGFTGWISAEYLTSCVGVHQGKHGCDGNDPIRAFDFAKEKGVPTGGQSTMFQTDPHTCVPYWNGGNPLKHMIKSHSIFGGKTSDCPKSCTNGKYPKPLKDDLHRIVVGRQVGQPGGMNVYLQSKQAYDGARQALYQGGPIVVCYGIYRDFMAYTGGIYKRDEHYRPLGDLGGWGPKLENTHMGYHAVVGLGYSPDFFLMKNSWGESWGEQGKFRICRRQLFRRVPGYVVDLGIISLSRSYFPSMK